MNFNFSATAGASQSSIKPQLKGNQIHEVKFTGVTKDDIQGKQNPTLVYKVLKFKFENEEGSFEHTIFEPKPEDNTRVERVSQKGETFKSPSNMENMMLLIKHIIDAVAPEIAAKIDKGDIQVAGKGWDNFRDNVIKLLDSGVNKETKIKLVKDQKGNPRFPGFFTGINSTTDRAYIRNNFVGKAVGFSAYELQRIKQEETAVQTSMSDTDNLDLGMNPTPQTDDVSLDFDVMSL